jgi:hypothetical protein
MDATVDARFVSTEKYGSPAAAAVALLQSPDRSSEPCTRREWCLPWRLSHKGVRSASSASVGESEANRRPGRRAVPTNPAFRGRYSRWRPRPIDGPDRGVVCATASMQRSSAPGALGDRSARRLDGQLVDRTPSTAGEMWDRTRLVQNPRLAEFAGRRPTHRFNVGLLAMQKPLGPTPIGRK